jgi:predicted methyltransferase
MWSKYNAVKPTLHTSSVLNVDKSSSFQVYTGVSEPVALTSNYYFGVNNSQVLTEKGKELVDEDAIFYYSRSRVRPSNRRYIKLFPFCDLLLHFGINEIS